MNITVSYTALLILRYLASPIVNPFSDSQKPLSNYFKSAITRKNSAYCGLQPVNDPLRQAHDNLCCAYFIDHYCWNDPRFRPVLTHNRDFCSNFEVVRDIANNVVPTGQRL